MAITALNINVYGIVINALNINVYGIVINALNINVYGIVSSWGVTYAPLVGSWL